MCFVHPRKHNKHILLVVCECYLQETGLCKRHVFPCALIRSGWTSKLWAIILGLFPLFLQSTSSQIFITINIIHVICTMNSEWTPDAIFFLFLKLQAFIIDPTQCSYCTKYLLPSCGKTWIYFKLCGYEIGTQTIKNL